MIHNRATGTPGCEGWPELISEPLGEVADVVVMDVVPPAGACSASVRARFDFGRGWPAAAAAASAACRSRRLEAGTQVLFTCVAQSKSRLLQHVRHLWKEQSFLAWFPHSWQAVVPGLPTTCWGAPPTLCFPASTFHIPELTYKTLTST